MHSGTSKMAGLYGPQGQRLKEVILASHRRSLDHRDELLFVFPERYSHCEECGIQQKVGEGKIPLSPSSHLLLRSPAH